MHRRMIRPDTITTVVRLSRRETERVNGNITMATKSRGSLALHNLIRLKLRCLMFLWW